MSITLRDHFAAESAPLVVDLEQQSLQQGVYQCNVPSVIAKSIKAMQDRDVMLSEENERLKEALAFYGDVQRALSPLSVGPGRRRKQPIT